MFPTWRLRLREARVAWQSGRYDDASRVLADDSLREFLPAKRLARDVADKIVERARDRFAMGDSIAGWKDLLTADRLGGANDSIARQFVTSDQFLNTLSIDARSQMKLVDYATLRARAGYAWGQFLPYVVVGIAAGRFNYGTTATVHHTGTPIPPAPGVAFDLTDSASSGKTNAIVGGVAAGLGIDWAVTPGLYLRAEWEYVAFAPVSGSRSNINTGKIGAGVRF